MRINKYIAASSGLSRRAADAAIANGRVRVNGATPSSGQTVSKTDVVSLDGAVLSPPETSTTIMLHKPVGFVVSRNGQGSQTIYDLLPSEFRMLNPIGRLDKDSSGLLLLTNDGQLTEQLTHPRHQKLKVYQITLNKPLQPADQQAIERGVELEDGISRLHLTGQDTSWTVEMREGRNRQIRRTFEARGYRIVTLHRTQFGEYSLRDTPAGHIQIFTHT